MDYQFSSKVHAATLKRAAGFPMASPVARPAGFDSRSPATTTAEASQNPETSRIPSLSEMPKSSAEAHSSVFVVDEYSQFQRTFGSYKSASDSNVEGDDEDSNDSSSTFWNLIMSSYFPVLLMWLRRGMFGTADLIRSLVVGHYLRLIFGSPSGWFSEKTPVWLHTLIQPHLNHHVNGGKVDPHAWPPPALVALALLTIFTLLVHPDGYTWIMLGKIRSVTSPRISHLRPLSMRQTRFFLELFSRAFVIADDSVLSLTISLFATCYFIWKHRVAALSFFRSSTQCWGIIINDYGVIPTVTASTTLAAVVFLLFVIMRTLSPKKRNASPPEKKKKKRKGRQRGGRIKSGNTKPLSPSKPSPPSPIKSAAERTPDLTPLSPSSSERAVDTILSTSIDYGEEKITTPAPDLPNASLVDTRNKLNDECNRRTRLASSSTLDTTAMSDDQSCGSTSIHSVLSVSITSSKSAVDQEVSAQPQTKKKIINNQRRNKRGGVRNAKVNPTNTNDAVASSRWDALKPDHTAHNHNHHYQPQNEPRHRNSKGRRVASHKKGRSRHQPNSDSSSHTMTRSSKLNQSRHDTWSPGTLSSLNHAKKESLRAPSSLSHHSPGLDTLSGGPGSLEGKFNTKSPLLSGLSVPLQQPSQKMVFVNSEQQQWKAPPTTMPQNFASFPARFDTTHFPEQPSANTIPFGTTIKENPFAPEEDRDRQIEADLQELGGQMAGSILDF